MPPVKSAGWTGRLQPFRYDGAQFSRDGISSVTKDLQNNSVSFHTRYAGSFVLASTPGDGDITGTAGAVTLHAAPASGTVGAPGTLATFTSDIIYASEGNPVPDGTFFTVAATLGTITTPDADGTRDGVQVSTAGGVLAFQVAADSVAGTAVVSAIYLDGVLHGNLAYVFAPGPATGPVDIYPVRPGQTAPGPVTFITGQIADAFGNVLRTDQEITLAVEGGTPAGSDARPDLPGHQLRLDNGSATFSVRVNPDNKYDTASFVSLYRPGRAELMGSASLILEAVPVPLRGAPVAALLLVLCAAWILARTRRVSGKSL